jgi:FMN-dependent NADH-azoreductase
MKLLHIIASPRGKKSRTLHVAREFLHSLQGSNPGLKVETLDLFKVQLPEVLADAVEAKYTLMSGGTLDAPAQRGWEAISAYSRAFLNYDAYLISSPMWNFTVPYRLKHYIDIIMQAGILFQFTETGVEGLAKNKKMFCITTRGSDYCAGSPLQSCDFQEPYLRAIFGMAGIYDIAFIHAQPMDYTPEITQFQLHKAKEVARSTALLCTV